MPKTAAVSERLLLPDASRWVIVGEFLRFWALGFRVQHQDFQSKPQARNAKPQTLTYPTEVIQNMLDQSCRLSKIGASLGTVRHPNLDSC